MNFEQNLIFLGIAIIIDCIIGDPVYPFHPVRFIGFFISRLEKLLFSLKLSGYIGGAILWCTIISLSISTYLIINHLTTLIHPFLSTIWNIFIIYSFISIKDLIIHGDRVYKALKNGNIKMARNYASMMVGRETSELTTSQIAQATVESLSENSSDGIIAPILFALIGGPIGITIYKTVNTMDSMIGYKNSKYSKFGFIAAKADDVFNFIPARVSLLLILLSKLINIKVWKLALSNRRNHFSPNSGYCEAAIAALLNVRMGGTAIYKGVEVYRPVINKNGDSLNSDHIKITIKVIKLITISILSFIIISLMLINIL